MNSTFKNCTLTIYTVAVKAVKMYYHIIIELFVRLVVSDFAIYSKHIYTVETHLVIEQLESIFTAPASDQQLLLERFESRLHYAQVPCKIDSSSLIKWYENNLSCLLTNKNLQCS